MLLYLNVLLRFLIKVTNLNTSFLKKVCQAVMVILVAIVILSYRIITRNRTCLLNVRPERVKRTMSSVRHGRECRMMAVSYSIITIVSDKHNTFAYMPQTSLMVSCFVNTI